MSFAQVLRFWLHPQKCCITMDKEVFYIRDKRRKIEVQEVSDDVDISEAETSDSASESEYIAGELITESESEN